GSHCREILRRIIPARHGLGHARPGAEPTRCTRSCVCVAIRMSYRSVLCATVASFMAAGCFETARNPWMQQSTLVSEQRPIPPHTPAKKKADIAATDGGRAVRPRNAQEGECGTSEECASLLRT